MEHIRELLKQGNGNRTQVLNVPEICNVTDPQEVLRKSLNVSSLQHKFSEFKPGVGTKGMVEDFKLFAERLEPPLILCWGGIGNGKTYMLEATAIRLRGRGIHARIATWNKFTGMLKNTLRDKGVIPSYEQILNNYCNAPVILMDDYGMGTTDTAWERGVLEELVNYRYSNRLATALTTNLKVSELPERVVSRFSEQGVGVVVENKGGDYRRRIHG